MERRQFLISSSVLATSLGMSLETMAASAFTEKTSSTKALRVKSDSSYKTLTAQAGISRLSSEDIHNLGIKAPIKHTSSPQGVVASFELKLRIARQYQQGIYLWFDTEKQIRVYDEYGFEQKSIPLPVSVSAIKDFALDSYGNLFILPKGQHNILWISGQGDELGVIGGFGTEMAEQLNGPRSLTVDNQDRLHVLDGGSRTVKVFKNNGVFLYEYGQSRWHNQRRLHSLDGRERIAIKGGMMQDSLWQFSQTGKLQ